MNLKICIKEAQNEHMKKHLFRKYKKECDSLNIPCTFEEDEFITGYGFFGSEEVIGAKVIQKIDDLDCFVSDEEAYETAKKKGIKFLETPEYIEHFPDTPENRKALGI